MLIWLDLLKSRTFSFVFNRRIHKCSSLIIETLLYNYISDWKLCFRLLTPTKRQIEYNVTLCIVTILEFTASIIRLYIQTAIISSFPFTGVSCRWQSIYVDYCQRQQSAVFDPWRMWLDRSSDYPHPYTVGAVSASKRCLIRWFFYM